jgi:hypothetical protein
VLLSRNTSSQGLAPELAKAEEEEARVEGHQCGQNDCLGEMWRVWHEGAAEAVEEKRIGGQTLSLWYLEVSSTAFTPQPPEVRPGGEAIEQDARSLRARTPARQTSLPMKPRLVWTSDPEAAKRLRQEGAIDAQADQDPSKQTIRVVIDRTGIAHGSKAPRGKERDHRQRIPAEG